MTEVRFYHLQRTSLEVALPLLLEKTLARGKRALVLSDTQERIKALSSHLWTYRQESWLPHGSLQDGMSHEHPIWLTDMPENPNGARYLFLIDQSYWDDISAFECCCELFNGKDEAALAVARQHWKAYQSAGYNITYFQQNDRGAWEEKN